MVGSTPMDDGAMMDETALRQDLPIESTVDLTEVGYDAGSQAVGIVNPTNAWRKAWDNRVRGAGLPDADVLLAALVDARAVIAGNSGDTDVDGALHDLDVLIGRLSDVAGAEAEAERSSHELLPYIVKRVVLIRGERRIEREIETAEDAAYIDNIDPRIMSLIVSDLIDQGRLGVQQAQHTFRQRYLSLLGATDAAHDGDGREPAGADQADKSVPGN